MFNRPILDNVLQTYQLKAQSDPTSLRSLIPAKEMWRFYIDGCRQNKTRSVEACIEMHSGYGADKALVQKMTICEFIRTYDESFQHNRHAQQVTPEEITSSEFYTDMDNHAFRNLLDYIIRHDLQDSVTIGDLFSLDTAWLAFEVHESGYLHAVQDAAHYARTCRGKFTVENILEIHKRCGNGVDGTNYAFHTAESIGMFRKSIWTGYDVSDRTMSVAGIFQLLKNLKSHQHLLVTFNDSDPKILGVFHLNAATLKGICDQVPGALGFSQHTGVSMRRCFSFESKHSIDAAFDNFRKEVQGILNGTIDDNSLMKLASYLYEHMNEVHKITMMLESTDQTYVMTDIGYRSIIADENMLAGEIDISKFIDETPGIRDKIATAMNQLLVNLYNDLDRQQAPAARLKSIIRFIQDCEQLHPFTDLNCRTFCMVMLQELLQRNGFPPTILDNPNCFDMLALEEIYDLVVQGMQNVFKLIGSNELYDVKTDAVISHLQSRPFLSRFATQFDEIVQVENSFRKLWYEHEATLIRETSVSYAGGI